MAFTGIAALVAGAEVTAAVVLAAVTEVGVALTVVGAVTGNKDLMKIGGVMSLVGGIGGMVAGATGAGAAGALSEAEAAGAMEAASAEATAASAADAAAGEAMGQASLAELSGEGIVGNATQAMGSNAMEAPIAQAAPAVQAAPTVTPTTPQPDMVPQGPQGATAPSGPQAPTGPAEVATPYSNPTDMRLANGTQTLPGGAPESSDSFFARFSSFAKNNKELLNTGTQLVGGLLKGASESDMWQQKMDLERDKFARANSVGVFSPTTKGIVSGARA